VILICIFLMTIDVFHMLVGYLHAIFSLEKCLLRSIDYFLIRLFVFVIVEL
jgi:hypothetical protein